MPNVKNFPDIKPVNWSKGKKSSDNEKSLFAKVIGLPLEMHKRSIVDVESCFMRYLFFFLNFVPGVGTAIAGLVYGSDW